MSAPHTEIYKPSESAPNPVEFDQFAKDTQEASTDQTGYSRADQEVWTHILLTIFQWDSETGLLKRIYSTKPVSQVSSTRPVTDGKVEYPVGGSKKMLPDAPWPKTVLYDHKVHLCRNRTDIQSTFSDYQTIFDTGAHTQYSIPLIEDGLVVGAVNLSGGEGTYQTSEVEEETRRFHDQALRAFKVWQERSTR